jgi:hypothetical protein
MQKTDGYYQIMFIECSWDGNKIIFLFLSVTFKQFWSKNTKKYTKSVVICFIVLLSPQMSWLNVTSNSKLNAESSVSVL